MSDLKAVRYMAPVFYSILRVSGKIAPIPGRFASVAAAIEAARKLAPADYRIGTNTGRPAALLHSSGSVSYY